MNLLAYILAESDFSFIEVIVVALFFGISIIGSIIKKSQEKKAGTKSGKQTPKTQVRQPAQPKQPSRYQPIPVANAQPPQQAQSKKTTRVAEELRVQQQRQAKQTRDQQKRMATRKSPESDSVALTARVVNPELLAGAATMLTIEEVTPTVSLATVAAARQAMIMHEIFLPPKALRQDNDLWDD